MNKIIKITVLLLLAFTIKSQTLNALNIETYTDDTSTNTTLTSSEEGNSEIDYQENARVFYNGSIWIEGEESLWNKTTAYIYPVYTNDNSNSYYIMFYAKNYSSRYRMGFICLHIKNLDYNVHEQEVQLAYRKDNPYHFRLLSKLLLDEI